MGHYTNISQAYQDSLRLLSETGVEVPATTVTHDNLTLDKSRWTKELLGYSFSVRLPHDRVIALSSRRVDLIFAIANAIWTIAGSNDLDFINYFMDDPLIGRTSMDLYCGYGKRLLDTDGTNQLSVIVDRIQRDATSRRAIAVTYFLSDNQVVSSSVPCPIAVQFFCRDGRLNAITYMRSQSAAVILPYDVFSFTFLQEAVAILLQIGLGTYYHMSGSFHYYLGEESLIREIVNDSESSENTGVDLAPKMPHGVDPFVMAQTIIARVNIIRDRLALSASDMSYLIYDLPTYWSDILRLLAFRVATKSGQSANEYLSELPEYYTKFLFRDREE